MVLRLRDGEGHYLGIGEAHPKDPDARQLCEHAKVKQSQVRSADGSSRGRLLGRGRGYDAGGVIGALGARARPSVDFSDWQ